MIEARLHAQPHSPFGVPSEGVGEFRIALATPDQLAFPNR